ncbi:hypothetical protein AB6A40_009431 [Gnathostoma spinigerum]|uniref:Rol-3 five-bladed beta-propeller domain-containing protein n=1 Tax=Gnathostoma spinigerum TaxID=75299 RepID=A0ABD6EUD5_9BILA
MSKRKRIKYNERESICSISADRVLVGLEDGSILWVSITDSTSGTVRDPDEVPIVHMEADHMQEKVYGVMEKKGIIRCSWTDCVNSTIITTNSEDSIQSISLDSWNGYMYCVTKAGEVFYTPLLPLNAPKSYLLTSTKRLLEVGPVATVEIDYEQSQLLILASNGSIFAMNLVNRSISDARSGFELDSKPEEVVKAHFAGGRAFWTSLKCGDTHPSNSCLFSEEYDTASNKIHINRYQHGGLVIDFSFLHGGFVKVSMKRIITHHILRVYLYHISSHIELSNIVTILQYGFVVSNVLLTQSPGSEWRNLKYQCRLMSDQTDISPPTEYDNLEVTSLVTPILPGLQYHASVRVCVGSVCSPFANSINSAFSPFDEMPYVMFNHSDGSTNIFDVLGEPIPQFPISAPLPANPRLPFALEPSTHTLFATDNDETQKSVFMYHSDGSRSLFLDTLTVTFLSIMPNHAIILIASKYRIVSYRLTSSFDHLIYSCDSMTNCGEVVGLTGDDETGDVFYLIQNANSTISLYGLNQENRTPYFVASSSDFPPVRQLIVVKEKFAFVTKSGEVGVCDKKLGSLNINLAVTSVAILQHVSTNENRSVIIADNIAIDDKLHNNITWNVSPSLETGKAVYKISLCRDNSDGHRFVDYTSSEFYVMGQELLAEWSSRQKFDVDVDIITAWEVVSVNQTALVAPTKPPSPPQGLKIFATQYVSTFFTVVIFIFICENYMQKLFKHKMIFPPSV